MIFSALTLSDNNFQQICTEVYCPFTVDGVTRTVRPVIGIFSPLHYQSVTDTFGPEDFIHEWLVICCVCLYIRDTFNNLQTQIECSARLRFYDYLQVQHHAKV